MLDVTDAFTAEEIDATRSIAHNLLVSWKKESGLANRTFTIGVSAIGGSDVIGINPGAIGSPGNYRYFDESDYALSLAWEQGLHMPTGGMRKGLAEGVLENTSGRFTPYYMGGDSELFTAILSRRPFIINAGFDTDGVDITVPQFSGIFTRQPEVDLRNSRLRFVGSDYTDFFYNRHLDQDSMWTSLRTDVVMENHLVSMGLSTAQYELDAGINVIPFGHYPVGTKYSTIFHELSEAENGHFYQDEEGKFRFENRYHWDSSPHNSVSRIIYTAQVIDAEVLDEDHIINVVEVKSEEFSKQPFQVIMNYNLPIEIAAGAEKEVFFEYDDFILQLTTPTVGGADSYYLADTVGDGTGTDVTSSIQLRSISNFAKSSKIVFKNNTSAIAYVYKVVISGRPVKAIHDIYVRLQDDSSVTAFEERPLLMENKFIQNQDWAQSYAQMILNDYAEPENLQKITIRALPSLQLGDLVSWQGRYWRIFEKKLKLDPSEGFLQELLMVQRQIVSYFRIGVSTIGGSDKIAP